MALQRQNLNINFSQGLDQKTDPKQVTIGKFLSLENSVFNKGGLLTKRNGFKMLASLPDTSSIYTTTFNGNLTAIGTDLKAFSMGSEQWYSKGKIQPLELTVLPLIRNTYNQIYGDSAVASNNLVCSVFTEETPTVISKYVVSDSVTGQNIIAPTAIPAGIGTVSGSQRVFILGNNFVIIFTNTIAGTPHLQYFTINIANPSIISAPVDISTTYTPVSTTGFDAFEANNNLYIAYNGSDIGGAVHVTFLNQFLTLHSTVIFTGHAANIVSVTSDITGSSPIVYVSYYASSNAYTVVLDQNLNTVTAPVHSISGETVLNLTSTAQNMQVQLFYEIQNFYGYDGSIQTDFIRTRVMSQSGTLGVESIIDRSVGLASKAFLVNGISYMLSIYFSNYQPTYFMIDQSGNVILKLAYSNAGTYYTLGLPNVTVNSNIVQFPYFFKDLIDPINKTQGAAVSAGVYAQTGLNLATVQIGTSNIITSEIGGNLNLTGGITWAYDGYSVTEQGFNLWPDNVEVTTSASGGLLTAQQYFYQVLYEWADNQGNIFRSAPSIPVTVTTTGSTSSNTINIPTLRLTYKVSTPVKIVIYRWSQANQIYYQVTSLTSPLLNDPTIDYVTFVDTLADSSIIGNSIIYTTGGVIEDIGAPPSKTMALFKSRIFMIDAEDPNLLWYSKQVIEGTPVEMSDLFTIYIAPTTGAQGSTGPTTCLSAMDDKLIAFKKDAIYYFTGTGPDNTGANNDFSDPIYITGTVGCANQHSIVLMQNGLMFQSDKGIWLLGRDLSTQYIGAPVEDFTLVSQVVAALVIPETNQVRFTMDSGVTLMYDYYYGQWGTFNNIPAISSTLYEGLHTFINNLGQVFQENPGSYIDGSNPVLMQFTTSWFSFAGLQGFQRAYFFYLLGQYFSPHKLKLEIIYDFDPGISQTTIITPTNFTPDWGGDPLWGSSTPWGGPSNIEQWRIFLDHQKCETFQISLTEIYDATFGVQAGVGLTLSGINLIYGMKKGYRTMAAGQSAS
jgi:hypothetical protein